MTNKNKFSALIGSTFAAGVVLGLVPYGAFATVAPNTATMYVHTTAQGDTLEKIAQRYLIDTKDWKSIRERNNISNPNAIPVGTPIRIRVAEMRMEPAPVKVLAVQGQVEANGNKIAPGGLLKEGDKLKTGDNGFVTIQLADGSTINVQSKSTVQLENARQLANSGGVGDSIVRLEAGRLETTVAKQRNPGARYEVRTPTSNMGVRGTVFRAAADESGSRAASEVLEGKVGIASVGVASAPELGLVQGFGTIAEAGKAPLPPIKLLPAPQASAFPAKLDEGSVEFSFPPVAKASKYRGQIARDRAFGNMLADVVSSDPKVKFADVPTGEYFVRVRAIDNLGLEGNDSAHGFAVQKALAAPNLSARTVNAAAKGAQPPVFTWGATADAKAYRLQVAKDAAFNEKLIDQSGIKDPAFSPVQPLAPGKYYSRVATVGEGGRESAFSAPQTLSVVAPAVPFSPPTSDGSNAVLNWSGSPGTSYQVQLARDEYFHDVIVDRRVTGNTVTLDNLPKGLFFVRVRDAASDAAPWSVIHNVDIYNSRLNILPRR
jgi:hypothetical protein